MTRKCHWYGVHVWPHSGSRSIHPLLTDGLHVTVRGAAMRGVQGGVLLLVRVSEKGLAAGGAPVVLQAQEEDCTQVRGLECSEGARAQTVLG